jgi:hypothetical protein
VLGQDHKLDRLPFLPGRSDELDILAARAAGNRDPVTITDHH